MDGALEGRPLGSASIALVLAGAAAIIAGLTSLVPPWVIVVGIGIFAVGCALPLRTFWRRRGEARATRR